LADCVTFLDGCQSFIKDGASWGLTWHGSFLKKKDACLIIDKADGQCCLLALLFRWPSEGGERNAYIF
jgi:hypothetical protein